MPDTQPKYTKRLHIALTDAQQKALRVLSTRTGQPQAYIARMALVEYIKRELAPISRRAAPTPPEGEDKGKTP